MLDEFGAFPAVIDRELNRYLPFLATTKMLMAAVRNGVGRETAHEVIKEAAVGTALAMRAGQADNDVFAKLAADARLGLTREQIEALVADPIEFTGAAVAQTRAVVARVEALAARHPDGGGVRPGRDPLAGAPPTHELARQLVSWRLGWGRRSVVSTAPNSPTGAALARQLVSWQLGGILPAQSPSRQDRTAAASATASTASAASRAERAATGAEATALTAW